MAGPNIRGSNTKGCLTRGWNGVVPDLGVEGAACRHPTRWWRGDSRLGGGGWLPTQRRRDAATEGCRGGAVEEAGDEGSHRRCRIERGAGGGPKREGNERETGMQERRQGIADEYLGGTVGIM